MVWKQYDSILSALYSNTLTMGNLFHWLRVHYDNDGVRDSLINHLYTVTDKEAIFYIPEIV